MADSQFSPLGLVLVAELARTRKAVGAPAVNVENANFECEKAVDGVGKPGMVQIDDVGEALARPSDGGLESPSPAVQDPVVIAKEKTIKSRPRTTGVRNPGMPDSARSVGAISTRPSDLQSKISMPTEKAAKKKKRRNVNPIDDLFEGLS